jgi:hypothetical protein
MRPHHATQLEAATTTTERVTKRGRMTRATETAMCVTKAGLQRWQMATKIACKRATTQQSTKAMETMRAATTRTAKVRGKGKI